MYIDNGGIRSRNSSTTTTTTTTSDSCIMIIIAKQFAIVKGFWIMCHALNVMAGSIEPINHNLVELASEM